MQFLEQEILEIAEATWQSIVGMQVSSGGGTATMPSPEGFLTGSVEISGAWNGVVLMHGAEPLIREAAAVIFGSNGDEVSHQDQLDAMYELTNIIGGNIKSLLPEPCQLALPKVESTTSDMLEVPGAERMSDLVFDCQGQSLYVSVWKK